MKCPKCSYERRPTDDAPAWQCPSCKVAYAKVEHLDSRESASREPPVRSARRVQAPVQTVSVSSTGGNETSHGELDTWFAARGQKIVIWCVLISLVLRAVEGSGFVPNLIVELLLIALAAYSLVGVANICSGLGKSQGRKIFYMVLAFVPLLNLVALLYLNYKATKLLRTAGFKVGLLGAR